MSKNDNILITKELALSEEEFGKKVTPEEMLTFIEEHFKKHQYHNEGVHYCKNIKYHSMEGFTEHEKNKLWDQDALTAVWGRVILPAIEEFERQNHVHIYTKGRMGGWIYVDEAIEDSDLDHALVQFEDETASEYEDRLRPLRTYFIHMWKFEKWFNGVQAEIKEYIKSEL